jgi:hypothetical protein
MRSFSALGLEEEDIERLQCVSMYGSSGLLYLRLTESPQQSYPTLM